jgi:Rad3-related DNA helicase
MALSAVRNHTRVFISTHTRNLQDQIISKDLPLAAKVIQGLTFSSLKGRSNYLCRHRWHRLLSGELGNLSPRERFGVLPLIRWAENTVSGDIEEQNQFNRKWFGRVWNLVAADSHNCLRSRCPGFDSCYVQRARRIALGSHCVVINHALFFSDMCAESPFLGDLGPIVFDEAHHLEECGHRYLRVELDTNRLERFIDICDNLLKGLSRFSEGSPLWESGKELKSRLKSMRTASELFLTDLKAFAEKDSAVSYDAGSDSDQFQIPYRDQPFTGSMGPATFEAAINALQDTILTTVRAIKAAGESAMDLADDASACVDRTSQLRADFAYVTSAITEDHVFWIEGSRKKGWIKLCGVPLDVGAVMRSVWDRDNGAIIFTSATMAVSDSMDFFLHKVGFMPGESRAPLARMYPSPFNPEQALRCVISGGVEPDDPQYAASVARSIEKLSVLNRNMLVLFTSNSMLSQVFESLRRSLSFPSGTLLLSQLAAGSRQTLLEQFRTSERAILLGADSFWEGIDVPGKSCEIVVIPRLPFQVPSHPLTQALSARAEALYGDSFINHSLPEALVRFRQGTGRLIRTTTDNGMLVVLDPRMTSRRYGKLFMKSVHAPFTVCPTIDEAIARADSFFEMKG